MGQRLAQPFAYDPQSGMLIAPWQRGELHPEDEQRLAAVLDQIAALDAYASRCGCIRTATARPCRSPPTICAPG